MSDDKKEFDLDAVAEEVANLEPTEGPLEEGGEVEKPEAEGGAKAEPEVKEEKPAVVEDDDHEKYAAGIQGETVPKKVFLERLNKESSRRKEFSSKYEATVAELEALRKARPVSADDVEKLGKLQDVFGNLDKAAREMPWLTPVLLALGAGKKPNWEEAQKGMTEYLKSIPQGDPILYQRMQELQQQQEELLQERTNTQAIEHVRSEDVEIAKIFGEKAGPNKALWDILNEQALYAQQAKGSKSLKELPDRVAMAKRLMDAAKVITQEELKKQLPSANRPGAGLAKPRGSGGGLPSKNAPPKDINSPEFAEWLLSSDGG